MLTVIGCFITEHDPWLLTLAAIICALAATSTVALLHHAQQTRIGWRSGWVAVAALAGGSGIWATHFLSMLAADPGLTAAYAVGLTVLSLVFAVLVSGIGLATAVFWGAHGAPLVGGAIVGLGIAAMHYTGMAAFQVAGHRVWSPALVTLSVALGVGLAMAALWIGLTSRRARGRVVGAALLAGAICGHHVLGMMALTLVPDPAVVVPEETVPSLWLALPVGLASLTILIMACTTLVVDLRDRQREVYRGRLLSLANAAVEGLVICQDGVIVSANDSFATLVGGEAKALSGLPLAQFVPDSATRRSLADNPDDVVEGTLYRLDGSDLPVELIMRPVAYGRTPHVALAVRDLTTRRRAERQIRFLVGHDLLTGLPNRRHFQDCLDRDIRQAGSGRLALLHINLDGFKEINDLFGNPIGDATLVRVARLVGGLLDETQTMARIGGDEFAVLTPCTHAVAAGRLAETIRATLQAAAESAPQGEPVPAATIGIAVFPDDARDRNDLLNAADTALLLAKSEGRGSYRFFEASMGQDVRERRVLEKQLRRALAEDQLRLVYQPQIETRTGAVIGFEVLLRWHQPGRGLVSPAVFIPIAEESGLIREIGAWVLREACREAARWAAPLAVAVNVSGIQVHDSGFAPAVQAILAETGLDPARLELEITETALIRDPDRALTNLRQLKALGLRLAMDDFGTGYSSLSNLRLFPFDTIKIDGSFIAAVDSNPQAAAIVRSVLGLGAGLGLPVIAEGVETAEELDFLVAEKCHAAQGYFIGRPGPISGFEQQTRGARHRSPVAA